MKPFLAFLVICGGILSAHADNQKVIMNVKTASGVNPIEVTTQSKITFSKDLTKMIVADGNGSQARSFDVDEIVNIDFTVDSADKLDGASLDELKISNNGKVLTISGGGNIEYAVWDMSGVMVASGGGPEVVSIDFNTLESGVYIVKANQSTLKYINH